ncbi:MAG: ChaB family protein [Rhodospirillaceae bacterium]|nr:ChaB family protein [Rhodospirillaceae bacterium]
MPYRTNDDLPPPVRHVLPAHAQDIYRQAFNNAWARYAGAETEREPHCHRIAWGAVKRWYRKEGGVWVPLGPRG